jgi:hypothetical protein
MSCTVLDRKSFAKKFENVVVDSAKFNEFAVICSFGNQKKLKRGGVCNSKLYFGEPALPFDYDGCYLKLAGEFLNFNLLIFSSKIHPVFLLFTE